MDVLKKSLKKNKSANTLLSLYYGAVRAKGQSILSLLAAAVSLCSKTPTLTAELRNSRSQAKYIFEKFTPRQLPTGFQTRLFKKSCFLSGNTLQMMLCQRRRISRNRLHASVCVPREGHLYYSVHV